MLAKSLPIAICLLAAACSSSATAPQGDGGPGPADKGTPKPLPPRSCTAAGGSATVAAPTLLRDFDDDYHEAWQAAVSVADLDNDGELELIAARDTRLIVWRADGTKRFHKNIPAGRVWASPIVADLDNDNDLEIVLAARRRVFAYDHNGDALPGFPLSLKDELRSIAAGDLDGDGDLEIIAATTDPISGGGQQDIIYAHHHDGSEVAGFPPNTTGSSGCDNFCFLAGAFDQNLAIGDIDGDGNEDILATHDNAYMSLHHGNGVAFDANAFFEDRTKWPGIRFLHDYAEAKQGWANNENSANQAHFTNSAPAIADIDGDGSREIIVLGSVQNAAQSDRERGVGLWVLKPDGARHPGWEAPFHAPDYLAGLWDYDGTNVVAATNQVTVADIDASAAGREMIFAGFDGKIHAVAADKRSLWQYTYTTSDRVLTGGVVVADLSADGVPEIIFNSYSPDSGQSHLFILDAAGNELHKLALRDRGAMPVPTIADIDKDGSLEILVSLKGNDTAGDPQVQAYNVSSAKDNCLLWPTARANDRRSGLVP